MHHPFFLRIHIATVIVEFVPLCKVGLFEELIGVKLLHLLLVDAFAEGADLIDGGFVDLEVHGYLKHLHIIVGDFWVVDIAYEGVAVAMGLEGLILQGSRVFINEGGISVGTY